MRDAIGQLLEDGDIVVEIDPSCTWTRPGVVFGGATKGGRVRYLGAGGGKYNSRPHALIKINEEILENATTQGGGWGGATEFGDHSKRLITDLSRQIKGNEE